MPRKSNGRKSNDRRPRQAAMIPIRPSQGSVSQITPASYAAATRPAPKFTFSTIRVNDISAVRVEGLQQVAVIASTAPTAYTMYFNDSTSTAYTNVQVAMYRLGPMYYAGTAPFAYGLLSDVARNFQRYRCTRSVFHWIPVGPTTSAGEIVTTQVEDGCAAVPNVASQRSYDTTAAGAVYLPMSTGSGSLGRQSGELHYIELGNTSIAANLRDSFAGTFAFNSNVIYGGVPVELGTLWWSFSFDLFNLAITSGVTVVNPLDGSLTDDDNPAAWFEPLASEPLGDLAPPSAAELDRMRLQRQAVVREERHLRLLPGRRAVPPTPRAVPYVRLDTKHSPASLAASVETGSDDPRIAGAAALAAAAAFVADDSDKSSKSAGQIKSPSTIGESAPSAKDAVRALSTSDVAKVADQILGGANPALVMPFDPVSVSRVTATVLARSQARRSSSAAAQAKHG